MTFFNEMGTTVEWLTDSFLFLFNNIFVKTRQELKLNKHGLLTVLLWVREHTCSLLGFLGTFYGATQEEA